MGLFDNLKTSMQSWLGITSNDPRINNINKNRDYVDGRHKRALRVSAGKTDDNVTINIVGLIVDRWVSWLFGRGIEFDLPGEDESKEQEFIDATWKANHKSILLHKLGTYGATTGTAYLKIIDDDTPRLIALDPQFVEIDTEPEDVETVTRYTVSYNVDNASIREVYERPDEGANWTATRYVKKNGHAEIVIDLEWKQPFSPIVHCQNLPIADSPYGASDITEVERNLQDAVNLVASNTNKAIRLHSAPQLWGNKLGQIKQIDSGTDKIIDAGDGSLNSIEMSEMTASSNFLQWLVKQLYVTTRTIDLDSLTDKLGNLTNFGLRVLYEDTMTKLATKRELYGEMLCEVNRRLLVIGGHANTDAGKVNWPDVIPQNQADEVLSLQSMKNLGVISNESIAMKLHLDYQAEQEKIAADKTSEGNIGEVLLKQFNRQ